MSKSVEFEVLLKTGKFREAAQESKKAIEDVGSALSGSSSAMSDEFSSVGERIEFQKEVIRTLKDEVKKLEAAMKNAAPGREWANVTNELQNVKRELAGEEQGLVELQGQVEQTEKKHVSLRAQIAALRDEMGRLALAGKENTKEYQELAHEAARLTDIYGDINQQRKELANDERNLQGIISGLTGLSGAFSAATGAVALFGGENENLQKIMLKVQSLMAITVGLQQVEQALNKDSAFRLVTINGLKEWWTKVVKDATVAEANETATLAANATAMTANATATAAAGTAATGTAGAFKILGASIKSIPVIGWILAAVAGLGSLIGLIVKERKAEKENNAVLKERRDIIKEVNEVRRSAVESVAEEESKLRTQIKLLKQSKEGTESYNRSVRAVAQSLGVNEEWLKRNKNKVDELADAWVNVKRSEAMSEAYAKQYAEERINGEKKLLAFRQAASTNNMEGNKQDLMQAGFSEQQAQVIADNVHRKFGKNPAKRRDGIEWLYDYEKKLIEDNQKALDTITGQQEAAIKSQIAVWKKYDELTKNTDGGKGIPGAETSDPEVKGWQAELAKLTDARNKALDEMKSLIGKTVHYDFGDVTYDASSIQADLDKIEEDFQAAVYELGKQYHLDVPVSIEAKEDDSAYQSLLDKYADYERKKSNIKQEFDKQRAESKGDAALIGKIDAAEKKALSELTMEALNASDAFGALFINAGRLGSSLKKLLTDRVKELVNFISAHKGDLTFATVDNASRFGISTEALANLLQSDDALKALVEDLDKIEDSDAISGLTKAIQKLKEAKNQARNGDLVSEEDVAKAEDAVMAAVERVKGAIVSELSNIGEALRDMGEYLDNATLKEAGDTLSDVLGNIQAAEAGAQAWGGWWGAIIGGVTDLIPRITRWFTQENRLNKELASTNKELEELDTRMQLLKVGGVTEANIWELDMMYEDYIAGLEKQIANYESKNKKGKYDAEIAALRLQIAQLKQERDDMWSDMFSDSYGLSSTDIFNELSDAIWEAFTNGETALDSFDDKFNEMMLNVIKKRVLFAYLGDQIESFVNDLGEYVHDGGFDSGEDSQAAIEAYRERWNQMAEDGMSGLEFMNELFGSLGAFGDSAATLSGSIQGITSEQASMLAGQMNAMRTAQAAQTALLTDQLEALNDIEHNTRYVRDIYNFLRQNNVGANSNLNRAYGQN